jgi:peptide/nickel transport system permease protein
MLAYSVRRIVATIPLLLIALYLVHVGVSATTDPLAQFRLCLPRCQAGYDEVVQRYDLDVSIWLRPFSWFGDAATGDLGESTSESRAVSDVLWSRGWKTAQIAVPAFLLSAGVALLLSVYSAAHQYSAGDYLLTGASFLGIAFPSFVLALLLQVVFVVQLPRWTSDWGWLPDALQGWKPFSMLGDPDGVSGYLSRATLPILSLSILFIAADSRFGRSSMLEVLHADYIRTARAKGVRERSVVYRHALRNALIPLVTLWALNFSALLGGSVVTETIFNWPGLGPAFLTSVTRPDLDLLMGIVMFSAVVAITFNLIADLLYGVLDPRIRYD